MYLLLLPLTLLPLDLTLLCEPEPKVLLIVLVVLCGDLEGGEEVEHEAAEDGEDEAGAVFGEAREDAEDGDAEVEAGGVLEDEDEGREVARLREVAVVGLAEAGDDAEAEVGVGRADGDVEERAEERRDGARA